MRCGRGWHPRHSTRPRGRLSAAGVEVHLDASGDALAARAGTLIKSPGVPQTAPVVVAARARGVPVLGELELAWRLVPNEFIAVTGTNGKTTTTEWIGHIHREAALPVAVAGNVGTAATSLVGTVAADTTVVCEASSFQLEDTESFAPEVAVLLNLQPDHLDRHASYDDYVAAKLRIFANQGNYDVAVAPDDLEVEDLGGCARRVPFGATASAELSLRAGHLWWDEEPLLAADEISLPGRAQPRQRDGGGGRLPGPGRTARRGRRRSADVRRRRPPPRADRHARRRRLRQRLQGHQRGQHAGGAAQLRRRACT